MCVKACQVIWGMRLADIHHIQGLLPIQLSHIVNTRKFPPNFPGSRLAHCMLKTILYYWNLGGIHFVSKGDLYTAEKKDSLSPPNIYAESIKRFKCYDHH